jgi:hypothetical protein
MTRRKSSSLKSKPVPILNLDVEELFRRMDEQRAKAAEMIVRARAMRVRAIEMQGKISAPMYPSSFRP